MSLKLFKKNLIGLIDGLINTCIASGLNERINAFESVKLLINKDVVQDRMECREKHKEVIVCNKCGKVLNIRHKDICPICFSETLYEYAEIEDIDKRVDELTVWINDLCHFEYERGKHNIRCENKIDYDGGQSI